MNYDVASFSRGNFYLNQYLETDAENERLENEEAQRTGRRPVDPFVPEKSFWRPNHEEVTPQHRIQSARWKVSLLSFNYAVTGLFCCIAPSAFVSGILAGLTTGASYGLAISVNRHLLNTYPGYREFYKELDIEFIANQKASHCANIVKDWSDYCTQLAVYKREDRLGKIRGEIITTVVLGALAFGLHKLLRGTHIPYFVGGYVGFVVSNYLTQSFTDVAIARIANSRLRLPFCR